MDTFAEYLQSSVEEEEAILEHFKGMIFNLLTVQQLTFGQAI